LNGWQFIITVNTFVVYNRGVDLMADTETVPEFDEELSPAEPHGARPAA
jgi:hypothetical protein